MFNNNKKRKSEKEYEESLSFDMYEIKEYHFHVYFMQNDKQQVTHAKLLFEKLKAISTNEKFINVVLRINESPIGPHITGSFECWCPIESFARIYGFLILNKGPLSILIHPLTSEQLLDHTDRSAFIGTRIPLNLSALNERLDFLPAQYQELGKGYSAN